MDQIDRRALLAGGVASLGALVLAPRIVWAQDLGWYDKAIIIDGLGGVGDPANEDGITRYTQPGWADVVASGVTVVRDTVMPVGNVGDAWKAYQEDIAVKQALFGANPDHLLLVRSAADIIKAKKERKFGVVLGTQDTSMVGPELDRLAQMKKDGVMTVQLTYNNANLSADGALEPRNAGLSKLGMKTIERIEAEKLLLDLSHGGARTMAEGVAYAKRPMVISHTAARNLYDHVRNTDDATIKAVADKGGVVGVYWMPFLTGGRPATMADVVAHIEHVGNVAGEDHVGIGTDNGVVPLRLDAEAKKKLDEWAKERLARGIAAPGEAVGVYPWVEELNTVKRYRMVASALQKRGWSVARLEKLFGTNFLRVYKDAWGS